MATIEKPKIINIPKLLGFTEHNRPGAVVWELPIVNKSLSSLHKSRLQNPWSFKELQLLERKDNLRIHKTDIALNTLQLSANLSKLCRKFFGHKTKIELQVGANQDFWCLFEFTQNGSPNKPRKKSHPEHSENLLQYPLGIGGFQFRLLIDSDQIKIVVSNHFGIGFVPTDFCSKIHRFILSALFLDRFINEERKLLSQQSIFEIDINLCSTFFDLFKEQKTPLEDEVIYDFLKHLATNSSQPNSQISEDGNFWKFQVPSPINNSLSLIQGFDNLSEDVLEARELANKYSQIEGLLLNGKINEAKKSILQKLTAKPTERYLLRRLSLLQICGIKVDESNLIVDALINEPNYLLFLSAEVYKNIKNSNHQETLRHLSQLGSNLMKLVPNANQLKTFDVVLPEILGDTWSFSNETKAEECYLRVIQKRGEQPRILKKLIQLAKDGVQPEMEYNLLDRLSKVERRHVELSKIYLRLAELQQSHSLGLSDAISQALKAVGFDRNNVEAALLAARLLNETDKAQEAIGLLDSLLQSPKCSISDKYRSNIHLLIGDLWNNSLNREELAESRYKDSLELNPRNARAIKKLELIYRRHKDFVALAEILESKFSLLESENDSTSLKVVFEELITIYRGTLGNPDKAYALCLKLIESAQIEPEEIDRMLGWREISIDWSGLYSKLLSKVDGTNDRTKLAKFHNRLADICKEKLEDESKALKHLIEAHKLGYLEKGGFDYLVEKTNEAGDKKQLLELYESRLRATTEDTEREDLISRLLHSSDTLTDLRRDELSLELYSLNFESDSALQLRFSYYQAMGDVDSIENLWAQIFHLEVSSSIRKKWSFSAIEYLVATIAERRFESIKRIYEYRIKNEDEVDTIVDEAIQCLKDSGKSEHLLPFIIHSIQNRIIPNISERKVQETLLGNQSNLANYYLLKFEKSTEQDDKAANARLAIAIWNQNGKYDNKAQQLLYKLSKLVLLNEDELQILMAYCEEENKWDEFARSLVIQLSLSKSKTKKSHFNELLESVYFDKLQNWEEAYHLNLRFLEQSPNNMNLVWKLAKCAEGTEDKSGAKKWYGKFINTKDALKIENRLTEGVQKLLFYGKSKSGLIKTFEAKIDQALESSDYNLAANYALAVIGEGIESTKIYDAIFLRDIQYEQRESAIGIWWRALQLVTTSSHARQYLKASKVLCEKRDAKLFGECLDRALKEKIGQSLGKKIHKEILIFHSSQIFENNKDRNRAFELYSDAFDLDPNDQRTWIPLYFLFGEFGEKSEKLNHLRHITAKIKLDPRPLKKYPITIESLEAELLKLEESEGVSNPKPLKKERGIEDIDTDSQLDLSAEDSVNNGSNEVSQEDSAPSKVPTFDDDGHSQVDLNLDSALPIEAMDHINFNDKTTVDQQITFDLHSNDYSDPTDSQGSRYAELPLPPVHVAVNLNESDTDKEPEINWGFTPDIPPPPVTNLSSLAKDLGGSSAFSINTQDNLNGSPAASLDLGQSNDSGDFKPLVIPHAESRNIENIEFQNNSLAFNLNQTDGPGLPVYKEATSDESEDENTLAIKLDELSLPPDSTLGQSADQASHTSFSLALGKKESNTKTEVEVPFALNDVNDTNVNSVDPVASGDQPSLQISELLHSSDGTSSIDSNEQSEQNSEITSNVPTNSEFDSENASEEDETNILPSSENSIHNSEFSNAENSEFTDSLGSRASDKVAENNHAEIINWRELISDTNISPETTQALMAQAFASEIEKHVAIQTAALLAGNCHILESWHCVFGDIRVKSDIRFPVRKVIQVAKVPIYCTLHLRSS